MNTSIGFENCLSFINSQLQAGEHPFGEPNGLRRRSITISRQAGSGAHAIAQKLAALLPLRSPGNACPWTVFDANIVEKVLEDHNLPNRLAKFMPEDRITEISDTMDELFGLRPPSWTLVRQTAETILRLVELGRVIIIGRGGNIITSRLNYVFHVRLVGSVQRRAQWISQTRQMPEKAALELIAREDAGRQRYIKKYFDKEIDDPMLYHMVINTDLVTFDEAAKMIADAVIAPLPAVVKPMDADHTPRA